MPIMLPFNVIFFLNYYCYYYYYYFKLLNLFRQQPAYSKENFCKPRWPQHTYYTTYSRNNSSRNEDARTRNEVHF